MSFPVYFERSRITDGLHRNSVLCQGLQNSALSTVDVDLQDSDADLKPEHTSFLPAFRRTHSFRFIVSGFHSDRPYSPAYQESASNHCLANHPVPPKTRPRGPWVPSGRNRSDILSRAGPELLPPAGSLNRVSRD